MTVLIALITLLDAMFLPLKGSLTNTVFISTVAVGIWKVTAYKNWYVLALVFITMATGFFLVENGTTSETIVHKLADWSYLFLIIGTIQLTRLSRVKFESHLSKLPYLLFLALTALAAGLWVFDRLATAQQLMQFSYLFIVIVLVGYLASLMHK